MDGWIFRPGYPLVTVEVDGAGLKLTQQRFLYLGGQPDPAEQWRIPVVFRASVKRGYVERRLLLDGAEAAVPLPAKPEWVVLNAGGHGFYRVRYAPALLKKLGGALAKIAPIERFNLLSDCFALSQSGMMAASDFLDLTGRFTAETDRNVWTVLAGSLAWVNRVIIDEQRPGLEALVRQRVEEMTSLLGWERQEGEGELDRQLRGDLLRVQGTLGNDELVQARAREIYARAQVDEASVDANVLPAVIAIVAASGGESEYAEFRDRYKRARTPQEEQRYLYALAGFRQAELLKQTLEMTINGEVRSQDAPFLIRALLQSVYGRGLAWEFIKQHWQTMQRLYPGSAYRRMYEGTPALVSPEWERDVHAFFAENKITLGGKTLEQYFEQLRVAVAFQEREAEALAAYLGRFVKTR